MPNSFFFFCVITIRVLYRNFFLNKQGQKLRIHFFSPTHPKPKLFFRAPGARGPRIVSSKYIYNKETAVMAPKGS